MAAAPNPSHAAPSTTQLHRVPGPVHRERPQPAHADPGDGREPAQAERHQAQGARPEPGRAGGRAGSGGRHGCAGRGPRGYGAAQSCLEPPPAPAIADGNSDSPLSSR